VLRKVLGPGMGERNILVNLRELHMPRPISIAERSKAKVYGRSLAGIAGSNPAGGMDICLL
jgi:hypothetical protein